MVDIKTGKLEDLGLEMKKIMDSACVGKVQVKVAAWMLAEVEAKRKDWPEDFYLKTADESLRRDPDCNRFMNEIIEQRKKKGSFL